MTDYNIQGSFNLSETFTSEVSGRIGIINQCDIPVLTVEAFNGVLPVDMLSVSKTRWRGDFRKRDSVWGIKETAKSSFSRISNAACLAGDLLSFYIEPEGHGVGSLDGKVVFAKSELELTAFDIVRGKSNSIVFNGFGLPKDDPGRFVVLKTPDEDADWGDYFFSDHGMSGLILLRIREKTEFHYRADWTDNFQYSQESMPRYNDSFVQIAIYPWNLSLREFDFAPAEQNTQISDLSRFIIDPVTEYDTEIEVFNNRSYFPSFRSLSGGHPVDLKSDEKNQVVRQNTMALISSQLPLLNSSSPMAPVLGLGLAEANSGDEKYIHPISRPKSWESQNSLSKSARSFSLTGTPSLINTLSGLNDFSKDNNQLSLAARNPLRVFLSNSDPDLTQISFALLGQKTSGISAPLNLQNSEEIVILNEEKDKLVDVYISIKQVNNPYTSSKSSTLTDLSESSWSTESSESTSENSGSSFTFSSLSSSVAGDSVVVSFCTEIPNDMIKSVSFAFAINNFDFKTFTDDSGLLRQKIFYADDYSILLSHNDIVYARIGIEDENGNVSYWYSEYNIPITYEGLSISDFRTRTRRSGAGLIDFYYNLQAPIEITNASVQFSISSNGGLSWLIPSYVYGDIGTVLIGQNRHITWAPLEFNPEYAGVILTAKLTVLSPEGTPAIGRTQCGYFKIENQKPSYISKHTEGIKRGYYDGENIKNPFIPIREHTEIIGSSSSISSPLSESSSSITSLTSASSLNSSSSSCSESSEILLLNVVGTANEMGDYVDGTYYYDGIVNGKKSFKQSDRGIEFFILWSGSQWILTQGSATIGKFANVCDEEDLPVGFNSYINPTYHWSGGIDMTTYNTCIVDSYPVGITSLIVSGTVGTYATWLNQTYEYICMLNGKKCFMNYTPYGSTNALMYISWDLISGKWKLSNGLSIYYVDYFSTTSVEGLPFGLVDQPTGGGFATAETKVSIGQ